MTQQSESQKQLNETIENLIEYIIDYETDVFSASSFGIGAEQANKIVSFLIENWVTERIDGIALKEIVQYLGFGGQKYN